MYTKTSRGVRAFLVNKEEHARSNAQVKVWVVFVAEKYRD